MIRVIDASVAFKWFSSGSERDADRAVVLLRRVAEGIDSLLVPVHFRAEVAAVLAREMPRHARAAVADLQRIEAEVVDDAPVLGRAIDLAIRLDHHLFDTLYHAVALQRPGAELVTADERYFRKAAALGSIRLLRDAVSKSETA